MVYQLELPITGSAAQRAHRKSEFLASAIAAVVATGKAAMVAAAVAKTPAKIYREAQELGTLSP